jgi:ribosomal protein S27E
MADAAGTPRVKVRSVNCPNCGAATAVRTFGHAVNVVCQSCGSILDAQDEGVRILQEFTKAIRFDPQIPLGTRGKILGIDYEVVGFQVRQITVDGTNYRWREYLLFNPYQPFRYITEFDGHWNIVSTLRSLPARGETAEGQAPRYYEGRRYRHFQTATAATIFVLGEFPWQVRVGETVTAADFVAPPRMLSGEVTDDKEVTWSDSVYVPGAEIWSGLGLSGTPPRPTGIFANQPSPYTGVVGSMWKRAALLMALAVVIWLVYLATAQQKQVFSQSFAFDPRTVQDKDSSFVTPIFELGGRTSPVSIETATTLDNQWMFVGYALVNDDTGQVYELGRDVSYYHGIEDGEAWTEGSRSDSVTVPEVPAGRYFLRIEPEGERFQVKGEPTARPVTYRVSVVRDVPTSLWVIAALVLLAVPPILASWRAIGFERRRWAESDHAPD